MSIFFQLVSSSFEKKAKAREAKRLLEEKARQEEADRIREKKEAERKARKDEEDRLRLDKKKNTLEARYEITEPHSKRVLTKNDYTRSECITSQSFGATLP